MSPVIMAMSTEKQLASIEKKRKKDIVLTSLLEKYLCHPHVLKTYHASAQFPPPFSPLSTMEARNFC